MDRQVEDILSKITFNAQAQKEYAHFAPMWKIAKDVPAKLRKAFTTDPQLTALITFHLFGKIPEHARTIAGNDLAFLLNLSTAEIEHVVPAGGYRKKGFSELLTDQPFDLFKAHFTRHALRQFETRYRASTLPHPRANPLVQALYVLAQSREEQLAPELRVERLVKNNGQEVRYFRVEDWRFIIKEGPELFIVLTFEAAR